MSTNAPQEKIANLVLASGLTDHEKANELVYQLEALCQEIAREAAHLHRYDANMDTCQLCGLSPEQLIENTEKLIAELTQKPAEGES